MNISARIKELRKKKAWSQEHLASVSGLSTKTIQRIESGSNKASFESQQALASAFDIELSELHSKIQSDAGEKRSKKYILEVYYEGECIEQRRYTDPIIPPLPGEQFYIDFENTNYSDEHGNWWRVEKRKHLKFSEQINIETLMLYCTPDPEQGR